MSTRRETLSVFLPNSQKSVEREEALTAQDSIPIQALYVLPNCLLYD